MTVNSKQLHLNTILNFGKYKGYTIEEIIKSGHTTDDSGIKYLMWLFNNTDYKDNEEIKSSINVRMFDIKEHMPKIKEKSYFSGYDSTDRNWEIGRGEMGSWHD